LNSQCENNRNLQYLYTKVEKLKCCRWNNTWFCI